jgi:hypothetical protein
MYIKSIIESLLALNLYLFIFLILAFQPLWWFMTWHSCIPGQLGSNLRIFFVFHVSIFVCFFFSISCMFFMWRSHDTARWEIVLWIETVIILMISITIHRSDKFINDYTTSVRYFKEHAPVQCACQETRMYRVGSVHKH